MSKAFKNKIVFVSGASSGIGEACAKIFAKHGANLILCARRIDKIKILAEELSNEHSIETHVIHLDVRHYDKVKTSIEHLPEQWKNIDVLVNNAGLAAGLDKIQDANVDDWERMFDTNCKGLLYLTRGILPNMIERNCGHVINIGSVAGHEVYSNGSVYCATKHAVYALTKGLKMDLLGTNIRVTSVDPGMVETEFSEVRFKGDKERAKKVYAGLSPLTAEDIADSIYYCASRPPHVNVLDMIIMPTAQAAATQVHRKDHTKKD